MGHFFWALHAKRQLFARRKNKFEITRSALAETVTKPQQAKPALHQRQGAHTGLDGTWPVKVKTPLTSAPKVLAYYRMKRAQTKEQRPG